MIASTDRSSLSMRLPALAKQLRPHAKAKLPAAPANVSMCRREIPLRVNMVDFLPRCFCNFTQRHLTTRSLRAELKPFIVGPSLCSAWLTARSEHQQLPNIDVGGWA